GGQQVGTVFGHQRANQVLGLGGVVKRAGGIVVDRREQDVRGGQPFFRGPAQPARGGRVVSGHSASVSIHQPYAQLSPGAALAGGRAEPAQRLGLVVAREIVREQEAQRDVGLAFGVCGRGGLAQPRQRRITVRRDP